MSLPPLILKKHEDRRLRAGHLWVFSNEVDIARSPIKDFEPGDAVEIRAHNGRIIGTGYVNPNSLICARLLSRDAARSADRSLLVQRLSAALSLRERLYAKPFYRLAFGESDYLPGLVVDRYNEVLVIQVTTAGMERMKLDIVAALRQVLGPAMCIQFRNDSAIRSLEGLPLYTEVAEGSLPDKVALEEGGCRFEVPMTGGQKTGWYFDQFDNRRRMLRYVQGKRVLDVFSYMGAWGIQAAANRASEVICVDSSSAALVQAARNAALNGLHLETRVADGFEALRELHAAGEKFDVLILDPPAFVKRKKDLAAGREAYRRLNQLGLQLLRQDGLLISCSCSYHMPAETLLDGIQAAARHSGYETQVLERGGQAADHPIHPAIPETSYLKAFFVRVMDVWRGSR